MSSSVLDVHTDDGRHDPDDVELITVGIDVGSSTSHLAFSRLLLRRLGEFLSSRYVVVRRETIFRSPILLTPYAADYTIRTEDLATFISAAYEEAGIEPDAIDTGAVILTGEAVKRTNARAIADLFARDAGRFVCASAGPNLEAILAAHGSGAVAMSRAGQRRVINVDIGGGTTKVTTIASGEIVSTMAISIGGRLIAMDDERNVVRLESAALVVAEHLGIPLCLGAPLSLSAETSIVATQAACLFDAARGGPLSELTRSLLVTDTSPRAVDPEIVVFSGGVAEFIYQREQREFGDLGRSLAAAIRERLTVVFPRSVLSEPTERIRATVLGASQFTVQVSGNTITISRPELLPLRNMQVVRAKLPERGEIRADAVRAAIDLGFRRLDLVEGASPVALAITWSGTPSYRRLLGVAEGVLLALPRTLEQLMPVVLVFSGDVGGSVGAILRGDLRVRSEVLSIDNIDLTEFDYIDVGEIIEPANVVPVVIKSLVFPEPMLQEQTR